MKVLVDEEIRRLLRPLTDDEYRMLRVNLKRDGCTEEFPIWSSDGHIGILLDGHNRREICLAEKIPFNYRELKFPSRSQAIQWVIDNQLGRRNLTAEQLAFYRGKEYLNTKLPVGKPAKFGHDGQTALELAKKHKVSERTIRRDAAFAEALEAMPKEEKAKVLAGKKTKAEIVKKPKKTQAYICPTCNRPLGKKVAFCPPSLEQVQAFAKERAGKGKRIVDPEQFWAFYEANGWVQGSRGKPIKDWRACWITWEKTKGFEQNGKPSAPKARGEDYWRSLDNSAKRDIWERVKAKNPNVNTTEDRYGLPTVRDSVLACIKEMAQ